MGYDGDIESDDAYDDIARPSKDVQEFPSRETEQDYLLVESDLHARALGERLKNRIFEEIFPHFALGFVNDARQHKLLPAQIEALPTEERNRLLEPIFNGTLTFLYRLLFLFYAESRDLLPVRQERPYYEQSLQKIKTEVAQVAGKLQHHVGQNLRSYSETETELYDRLMLLFQTLDKGNPTLNVPIYNGGLFLTTVPPHQEGEPAEITLARFLAEHKVPDRQLALGLDLMARDVDERMTKEHLAASDTNEYSCQLVFIDYKRLGVRHLGSIYEELLEFKLRIAPEEMAVVEGKRTEEIIPHAEAIRTNRRILKLRRSNPRGANLTAQDLADAGTGDRKGRDQDLADAGTGDRKGRDQDLADAGTGDRKGRDGVNPSSTPRYGDAPFSSKYRGVDEGLAPSRPLRSPALIRRGAIYLENDRHERKASGSYYTPDYIVKYIVEQTVGPILKQKLDRLHVAFLQAQQDLQIEYQNRRAIPNQQHNPTPEHQIYERYSSTLNDAFFDIKVLDPAMGCGYFLIEVVDYITDQMAKWLNTYKWNPIVHELGLTRKAIEEDMQNQNVTIDLDKLTDLNLLKRRVLKSCIYGVDLNPMAVELTRISLWLNSFTVGIPLSFLDHHIKCGNSLIGAEVSTVLRDITENLFGCRFGYLLEAAQLMRGVSKRSDVTAKEVAESRQAYQRANDILRPHKRLFDVWLSQHFGNHKKTQQIAGQYAQNIVENTYAGLNQHDVEAIKAASVIASSKRFFHWEWEFPEIYFDEWGYKEDGGFDSIVGNPPYGLITDDLIKAYCRHRFKSAEYQIDNYVVFIENGIYLAREDGMVGFIVPTTYIGMHYFTSLRALILARSKPKHLLKFTFPVFEDAAVESSILILQSTKSAINDDFLGEASIYKSLTSFINRESISTTFNVRDITNQQGNDFFFLQDSSNGNFVRRLHTISVDLAEICDMTVGIKPYQVGKGVPKQTDQVVQNRIFDANDRHDESYKRYLIGRDINRYQLAAKTERWISYGEWLAEPRSSAPFFEQSKILVRQTADSIIAVRDTDQFITLNNLHNLKIHAPYLEECYVLAFLNSKLATYYFRTQVGEVGRIFAEVKLVDLAKLPIRRINFITPNDKRAYYRDTAQLLYQQCLQERGKPDRIIGFVEHHLSQQPEASDVVHDLLALLAEEMLRLNKEKRVLQQEFLAYLVDMLHINPDKNGRTGVEVLAGKSRLLDYAGDYQKGEDALSPDDLWELVRKNRARVEANLAQTSLKERVLAKYQQNLDQVLPLKEQLQHTDALIDRVVYQLYGLTEEEIAVVDS